MVSKVRSGASDGFKMRTVPGLLREKKRYSDQKDEQDDPSSFAGGGGGGDEPEELTEEEIDQLLKSDKITKRQKKLLLKRKKILKELKEDVKYNQKINNIGNTYGWNGKIIPVDGYSKKLSPYDVRRGETIANYGYYITSADSPYDSIKSDMAALRKIDKKFAMAERGRQAVAKQMGKNVNKLKLGSTSVKEKVVNGKIVTDLTINRKTKRYD